MTVVSSSVPVLTLTVYHEVQHLVLPISELSGDLAPADYDVKPVIDQIDERMNAYFSTVSFLASTSEIWRHAFDEAAIASVYPCKICRVEFYDLETLKSHMVYECNYAMIDRDLHLDVVS